MPRRVWLTCFVTAIFGFLICLDDAMGAKPCKPAPCGDLDDIRFPFRMKINGSDDPNCLSHPAELSCEQNRAVLKLFEGIYYVKSIDYRERTISVVDPGLLRDACSFRPLHFLSERNFSDGQMLEQVNQYQLWGGLSSVVFFDCSSQVDSPEYVRINCSSTSSSSSATYSYIMLEHGVDDLHSCNLTGITLLNSDYVYGYRYRYGYRYGYGLSDVPPSFSIIRDEFRKGFQLSWERFLNRDDYGICYTRTDSLRCHRSIIIALSMASFVVISAKVVVGIFCYVKKSDRTMKKENQIKIEKFLDDHKSHVPTRYSYADIKKMTSGFKKKLGEGGFGSVFSGKLPNNGVPVAIKVLKDSKGNGDDFVNEVGTIGRIHHVNVVRLLGFSAEEGKRALIYEDMPNSSLEKFITSKDQSRDHNASFDWMKLHNIITGIAKGIEYLHQGCDQRILHFDIKPHNILLDHDFNPKISDFGLAKLCSKEDSLISMTAARGTVGYIAREVFNGNFGTVSYKSDVYSFGMLVLEAIGARKVTALASSNSEVYFPELIYKSLIQGEDLNLELADDEDAQIAKRLAIVALWCIQWYPVNRPSMKGVLRMLEGASERLIMPPNPFASTTQSEPTTTLPT